MSGRKYQMEFEDFCLNSDLGELMQKPVPISGGLLHKMYALETTKGNFAMKLLNPNIMARPTAMRNYINSEEIACLVSKKIPALPAIQKNGSSIHNVNGQFYLVFDWIDGRSLEHNEINAGHCEKIGRTLGDLHQLNLSELEIAKEEYVKGQRIEWNHYLEKGRFYGAEWVDVLLGNLDDLKEWNDDALEAANDLSVDQILSHRDLDPKNVMWKDRQPVLIDWESAGFIHPMQDLIETVIYWSVDETGEINQHRFFSFLNGYKKSGGNLQADWKKILATGFLGKLGWLEYSLKRSLGIESVDKEEQKMGTAQVTGTVNEIRNYAEQIPQLLLWLMDESNSNGASKAGLPEGEKD